MNRPISFGLIGYGAWGSHHAQAIAGNPDARLVAIAAKSEATQASAREAFSEAEVYGDYRLLVARDDLDAVAIVLPSHLHVDAASAALSAGRHVLLEKPMALTVADCDRLIELAGRQKKVLAVGHELRLSSLWGKVKELVEGGGIGRPLYCLVELSRRPYRLGAEGWRFDIGRVGNWILEEPIHFFDLARWYLSGCGEPAGVYARANASRPESPELEDNFSAIVDFPGGAYAVVSQTLCAFEHHQTVKLAGDRGALWASWSGAMDRTRHPTFSLRHFDGEEVREIPLEKTTGEVFELEDQVAMFVAALRGDLPLATTADDGRWSVRMCLAAQRSVEEGRAVRFDDG